MHQAMGNEIEDGKGYDNEQDPPGLRFDEVDQTFRIGQQTRRDLVSPMTDVGQQSTGNRGPAKGGHAEDQKIHPNNAGRDRD